MEPSSKATSMSIYKYHTVNLQSGLGGLAIQPDYWPILAWLTGLSRLIWHNTEVLYNCMLHLHVLENTAHIPV